MTLLNAIRRNSRRGNFRYFSDSSRLRRAIPILLTALLAAALAACDSTTTRPPPPPVTLAGPAIDVSAGGWRSCSVRMDGRIVCWGLNSSGSSAEEPADSDFQSISVGSEHACAIRNNGDLACWNDYDNTIDLREGPFVSVSSGMFHSCAIQENGKVECWYTDGAAPDYRVGQAGSPAGWGGFQSVSAGDYHTCAVTAKGATLCWGDDEFGQSSPPEGQFSSVSAGSRHTCGVRTDGSVACWGSNVYGRLVQRSPGSTFQPTNTPNPGKLKKAGGPDPRAGQASPPTGSFQSVSAGYDHTCGIRTGGTIACWGVPAPSWYGAPPLAKAQTTPPQGVFRSVSTSASHTCAVRKDGVIICWGDNNYRHTDPPGYVAMSSNGTGYLCEKLPGGGNICWAKKGSSDPSTPPDIPAPTHYTAVIAGAVHTCGLTDYAAIACWGVTGTPLRAGFRSIAHGCAVTVDGPVACWRSAYLEGEVAPPSGEFISISGGQTYDGRHHFCGLAAGGSVQCWGYDFGNRIRSPSGTFRQISVHGSNACGIRPDGTLYCWWYSFAGLSGDPVPQGQFQSVSVGKTHACAIRDNGRVVCWGYGQDGSASPPRGKFKSVSVGGSHSCGIRSDDTLACWGSNVARYRGESLFGKSRNVYETHYGQAEPAQGTFRAVAAGGWHTCGIRTDGRATCWGANNGPYSYTLQGEHNYYGQATPSAGNH